MSYLIKVYTSFERGTKKAAFEFNVSTKNQVRDHVNEMLSNGYRRIIDANTIEWYPPHIITRVEVNGPDLDIGYQDSDITNS